MNKLDEKVTELSKNMEKRLTRIEGSVNQLIEFQTGKLRAGSTISKELMK